MTAPSAATREFHTFFNLPSRTEPQLIEDEELEFRKPLIREEYEELMEALDGDDLEHIFKEMADVIYVVYGLDQHLGQRLDAVFDEVHRSNMTKLWTCDNCGGRGTKRTSMGLLSNPQGLVACLVCDGTGKHAKYREDGKVLKPPTYEKPDLSKVVFHDGDHSV